MWTPSQVMELTVPQLSALARQARIARGEKPESTATPGEMRRFLRSFGR
jgi:hypothetical protein